MKGFTLKELASVVNPFTPEARIGTQVYQQTETVSETEVEKYFEETETMIIRLEKMTNNREVDPHVIEDLDKLLEELESNTRSSNKLIGDFAKFAKSNNRLLDAWFQAYQHIPNSNKLMKFDTYSRITSLNLRLGKITF